MKSNIKKTLSVLVAVCFLLTSVGGQSVASVAGNAIATQQYKQIFSDFMLPYSYGKITDAHFASTDRVIINIQDLHCHPKVQKNISNIIDLFDKRYGVKTVYLEGAYGDVDTSWITKIGDSNYKNTLLDKMVDTGRLTGAEYFSAVSGKTNIIKGLEKKEPYLENLKRFGEILDNKEKIELILKSVNKSTQDLKSKYYDRRQLKLEQLAKDYADGKINSEKYFILLSKHIDKLGIDIYKYDNTLSYMSLLELQKNLKYTEITKELQNLVLVLKGQLPFNAYKMLLDSTGNFAQTDKLYGYLVKITKQYNLDLSVNYPELDKYFGYVELSQKINPLDLIKEEKDLINEINTRFSETKAQREVVFILKFEKYLENYLTSKITKDDYEYYSANIAKYRQLWDKYVDNRVLHMLDSYIAEADKFYKINTDRNEYFTKNITEGVATGAIEPKVKSDTEINKIIENMQDVKRVDVIITGGFHTTSISDILDNQHVSYIVITPNVSDGTKYAEDTYYKIVKEQSKISFQTLANLVLSLSPLEYRIRIMLSVHGIDGNLLINNAQSIFGDKVTKREVEKIVNKVKGVQLSINEQEVVTSINKIEAELATILESDDTGDIRKKMVELIRENLDKNSALKVDEGLLEYMEIDKLRDALSGIGKLEDIVQQALQKKEIANTGTLNQSLIVIGNIIDNIRIIIEKQQSAILKIESSNDTVEAGSESITRLQKILIGKIISILFKGISRIDNYAQKSGAYVANFKKYIESLGWEFDPGTADVVYSGYKGNKYKDGGAPKLKEIVINKEIIDARNDAAKHSIFKLVENVSDESGRAVFKISYYEIPQDDSSVSGYDMLQAVNAGKYKPFLVMQDQYLLTPSRNLKEILKKDKTAEEQKLIDLLYDPAYGIYVCQKIDTEEGKSKFIISSVDLHVDSGVWGTMIDTVIAASMLAGLKGTFKNVIELGSGAGHISAAISQLPGVENVYFTDISPFALTLSKSNIVANNGDIDFDALHAILGPGVLESNILFDLLVANPPYVDEPPNLRGEMDLTAYGGTKFLREILEKLTKYLNVNNQDAQAILSVSSTTRQALERYLAELGYEFIFEQVGESKRVPFKVYKVLGNEQWINWLAEEGMVYPNPGYKDRGEEPYYHDLTVYRVRLKTSQVKAEDAQNAKAVSLERFRNLNPTRGPSITDEEFDGALDEAFGNNSQAKTKFLNDLAFEGSIKYQIWHTYLSNIPNITLAQQIKLLASVIKIVEAGNYNQKAISIDLTGFESTEDSSYLQYLLNQSIDNISAKLSTKTDNGTIRVFTSLANKKFKKAQECVSLLKELKISLPELTGVLLELMDEDISNIDLNSGILKKKISERIRKTVKPAKKEKGVKTEFQYEDIDNMKTYNSWTRKYQDYITTIINSEMDKAYGTKEDKINNLIEIFGGYKNLDSMQATALFNLYRENDGSFSALIKLYENVGEYAVEFKESLAIKEFYFVAFNKTKSFETTIEKLSDPSQEKNGELYGSLGKAYYERYTTLKKEYAIDKSPQVLEKVKQALKDSYDAYNAGYQMDYYYYPGINAVYRAIELSELETDKTQKKYWQDEATALAELVYLSTEKAGGIRSGDYWPLITMVEAMAISGKYSDANEFAKMQKILNKALEFVTAAWEVDSTLSNLEPLLSRKQNSPNVQNLQSLVKQLHLKKLELLIPSFDENRSKLEKTDENDEKYADVKAGYEKILNQIKKSISDNAVRTYTEEEIGHIISLLSKSKYYGLLKNEIKQNISEETFSRLEKEGKAKRKADVADKKTTKSEKFTKALLAFCYRFPVFSLDIFQTKSISGNYQYGGGLQEMMLGREDIKIAEQIIKDLDLENTDDIDVFMARIDEIIRRQYRNDELHLEDLKSEGHGRFDDSIKAIQELTASGRTTDSRTNIMLDFLLGIGDCRQHGETKQILFEVWKEMRIKGYFVDARTAIDKGDTQVAATSFEKIRQLLKKQMFTMEALVTGNVAMNGKYNVFKDKDGNPIKSDKVNDIEEHVLTVLVELDDEGNVVMDKDGNFVNGSFRLADSFYQHEYKFGWGQLDIKAEDCSVGEDGKLIIKAGTTENGLDIFLTEPKVEYAGHESRVESRSKKGKLNNVFGLLYRGLPSVTSLLSRMFDVRKEYIAEHAIELIRSKNKSDDSVLRKSFDMFSSSLLQYYRNIVKKLDRGVFDGIINGLKEFMEIKDDSTIQITDEMLSKYAIAGLPDFGTFIKELNLNPEQSLKLAEVFHNYGYYEDIRKNEIDNSNSPVIDTRLLDSNFNPNAEKLLSCLTDQAREVIEKRHRRSAREKIKLTIFDIKEDKMTEFFRLAGKENPESLIEARRYIDKNARSWYEAGYLSEDGKKKIEAGNTNLTKNDFTKDGFENIDKSIIKKAETPVVNTLQVRWEYLQQDIGKYEVLNKKGEWLRKESLQKQEERKQFLIEQQTSGVVVTIATLMYLKNHNITDGLLALKLIHAGWSVNNKWDLLAKAHYDDLSVEEKRKDLIYLEAVSKFLLFDQDPVIAKMLESAKESLTTVQTAESPDSTPAVSSSQSETSQAKATAQSVGDAVKKAVGFINPIEPIATVAVKIAAEASPAGTKVIDYTSLENKKALMVAISKIFSEGKDGSSFVQELENKFPSFKITFNKDGSNARLGEKLNIGKLVEIYMDGTVRLYGDSMYYYYHDGDSTPIIKSSDGSRETGAVLEALIEYGNGILSSDEVSSFNEGIKKVESENRRREIFEDFIKKLVQNQSDSEDGRYRSWFVPKTEYAIGNNKLSVGIDDTYKKLKVYLYGVATIVIEITDSSDPDSIIKHMTEELKEMVEFNRIYSQKDKKEALARVFGQPYASIAKVMEEVGRQYPQYQFYSDTFFVNKSASISFGTDGSISVNPYSELTRSEKEDIIKIVDLLVEYGNGILSSATPAVSSSQSETNQAKTKLELPSVGRFLDKLGITQEKSPKFRAFLVAVIEGPIIAVSKIFPNIKAKFFKAHNFDVSVENTVKEALNNIVNISFIGTIIGTAVGIATIIIFILNPVSSTLFLGLFTDLAIVIASTVVPHMNWNIKNPSMRLELPETIINSIEEELKTAGYGWAFEGRYQEKTIVMINKKIGEGKDKVVITEEMAKLLNKIAVNVEDEMALIGKIEEELKKMGYGWAFGKGKVRETFEMMTLDIVRSGKSVKEMANLIAVRLDGGLVKPEMPEGIDQQIIKVQDELVARRYGWAFEGVYQERTMAMISKKVAEGKTAEAITEEMVKLLNQIKNISNAAREDVIKARGQKAEKEFALMDKIQDELVARGYNWAFEGVYQERTMVMISNKVGEGKDKAVITEEMVKLLNQIKNIGETEREFALMDKIQDELVARGYNWAFEGVYQERTMAMISKKVGEGKDKAVITEEMVKLLNQIKDISNATREDVIKARGQKAEKEFALIDKIQDELTAMGYSWAFEGQQGLATMELMSSDILNSDKTVREMAEIVASLLDKQGRPAKKLSVQQQMELTDKIQDELTAMGYAWAFEAQQGLATMELMSPDILNSGKTVKEMAQIIASLLDKQSRPAEKLSVQQQMELTDKIQDELTAMGYAWAFEGQQGRATMELMSPDILNSGKTVKEMAQAIAVKLDGGLGKSEMAKAVDHQIIRDELVKDGYGWAFEGGYLERTMAMISQKVVEGKDKTVITGEMEILLNRIKNISNEAKEEVKKDLTPQESKQERLLKIKVRERILDDVFGEREISGDNFESFSEIMVKAMDVYFKRFTNFDIQKDSELKDIAKEIEKQILNTREGLKTFLIAIEYDVKFKEMEKLIDDIVNGEEEWTVEEIIIKAEQITAKKRINKFQGREYYAELDLKEELKDLIFKDMLGERKITDRIRFGFEVNLKALIYEYFDKMSPSERRMNLTKTGNSLNEFKKKIVKDIERKVFSEKKELRTFLIARGYETQSLNMEKLIDDIINGGKTWTLEAIIKEAESLTKKYQTEADKKTSVVVESKDGKSTSFEVLKQVKTAANPIDSVQKMAITIVIGKQALESLQKGEFNAKEVMLVINDSLKAEELRGEGLNVATAVIIQKKEKAKLKGSKKIGTIGNYNGAVVRAYWNAESKDLMFYSKSGLEGADIEQLKEMFANMQTEGIKTEAFKGISQIVVTDKENYDEMIKAMENAEVDTQSAIMVVKGIELDLTKRTGKINETVCKNECLASGTTTFVITEQQANENSQNIDKMQKEGYKFIIKYASIIGAESITYDGAKIDASAIEEYKQAIKLLDGLKSKALAKGGISVKFHDDVYKMLAEAGIDIWQQYGIIPIVNSNSAYINGQIGRVEVEEITEQNIDSILSQASVMTIVVDNAEILSDRKDAIKEAKTAKEKQKKEYKAGLKVNIKYALNSSKETEIKELISSIADIIGEDLTEDTKPEDQGRREKVIEHIKQIQQSSFYQALDEKAKSRIDHLMKDKDAVQTTAAFIRVIAMRTAEEFILSWMRKNGINITPEEFRKFQDGRFREAILIRAVQLWLSGQDIENLLETDLINSDMTAEEYMRLIMNKVEGIESNTGRICIDNEYKISSLSDVARAIEEFKEFNIVLQDRFRQIGINKEVKVSVLAVKSMLGAA